MSVDAGEVIAGYPVHPAAALFPMLDEEGMAGLAEDIRVNGQLEPIWLLDGQILDGRNRLVACQRSGVEPKFREWSSDTMSPTTAVIAWNLSRRHLTPSQRAALAVDIESLFAEEIRRQRVTKTPEVDADVAPESDLNDGGVAQGKVSDGVPLFTAPAAPAKADKAPRTASKRPATNPFAPTATLSDTDPSDPAPSVAGRARDHAAKVMHVSTGYVSHAKKVARESPELHDKVRSGEISLSEARRRLEEPIVKPKESTPVALPKPVRRRRTNGKVTSSKISLVITATFGNPKIAEEILIRLLEDPRVMNVDYNEADD